MNTSTNNFGDEKRVINMFSPLPDFKSYEKEYMEAVTKVLNHGLFINGPEVKLLEKKLADYTGTKHCVCVGNGTDAIQIALMALDIGKGDEVITVAHTWISTAETVALVGATPIFIDIENNYFNINIDKIESSINENTKAILVVSLYGQTPDLDRINSIAKRHNIHIIEDGAQSFGATFKGRQSCSLTTIGTTSFFPSKPLGCYGDGGACFTNDDDLAFKIRAIKNHGGIRRFNHQYIGVNSRLDTIQAAVLLKKLDHFDEVLERRREVAQKYIEKLAYLEKEGLIKLPKVNKDCQHVWAQFSILLASNKERERVFDEMKQKGINLAIFYPAPLHLQPCFSYLNYNIGDLPITENTADRIINLPCFAELGLEDQDYVIDVFQKCFNY